MATLIMAGDIVADHCSEKYPDHPGRKVTYGLLLQCESKEELHAALRDLKISFEWPTDQIKKE